jgi:hypothetical protein
MEEMKGLPGYEDLSDVQKLLLQYSVANQLKDAKSNRTETLPVDHEINSTGGSEIVEQGPKFKGSESLISEYNRSRSQCLRLPYKFY